MPYTFRQLKRWLLATSLVAAVIFLAAGTLRDLWLWGYVTMCSVLAAYAMFSLDDDLAKERFHPPTQGADARALLLVRVVAFSHLVVGAADAGRWHLADTVPGSVRALSLATMAISFGMFYRAMRENRFFSSVVRLQSDRGHQVIDTGPYRIVRHPGYAGLILGTPVSGLALGSWFAVALGLVLSALILRRVLFEDAFLQKNLDGYGEYTHRVPHRLIPGLW
jgi:protein-S-isoprenylcysteine O-methyltransferase Ste14